jgi:ribosomal protein S18 acetylase RimI-like enzyme
MFIRLAIMKDIPELGRLNTAFNGGDESMAALAARFEDPRRIEWPVVAEVDGRLVGFAALRLAPGLFYAESHAEMTELYVENAYRRRGIGRELVRYVERMAVEMGAAELWLMTGKENFPAQEFYRSLGYEQEDIALSKELERSSNDDRS